MNPWTRNYPQINNTSTDNMTLKEAKKLLDNSKEKLQLVLRRETHRATNTAVDPRRVSTQNTYDAALNKGNTLQIKGPLSHPLLERDVWIRPHSSHTPPPHPPPPVNFF